MNQAKRILRVLQWVNSSDLTQLCRGRSLHTRVAQIFHPSPSLYTQIYTSSAAHFKSHGKKFFSPKSEPIIQTILSNDWAKEIEKELTESKRALRHETVIYVLMKFDKEPAKASNFLKWAIEKNEFSPSSSIYSLVLRIYASKDSMKEFWVTIKEMKEKGFYIDEETYLTILTKFRGSNMTNDATTFKYFYERMIKDNAMGEVVDKVVEAVTSSDWGSEVERKLGEMKLSVSDNFVLRVLKELRAKGHSSKVLRFFNLVGESLDFKHSSVTYNSLLRILCREDSIGEFWHMMKEIKSAGYDVDIDTYVKISREFQKRKMLNDAVQLYEYMMDSPFKPLGKECSLLLRIIAGSQNPDLDLVFRVVKKYESVGHCLSKIDYDGIHRSLTSAGRFDEAEKIVEKMRNAGYSPDNITYSQLMFGLSKAQRLEDASDVLDRMEGQGCVPDIKTWTILIKGHCEANDVDKALLCFAKMVEKGFDIDADLLDVLVKGFLRRGRVVGAYKLLVEMVNRACLTPWQATYKILVEKLLGERRLEEAFDLLRLMKKQNYPPYPEPFVRYISREGSVEDAGEFLKALSVKQYPSVAAYHHVLQSFFNEGRYSEAKDLLFLCPLHIRKHPAISTLFGSSKSGSAVAASA